MSEHTYTVEELRDAFKKTFFDEGEIYFSGKERVPLPNGERDWNDYEGDEWDTYFDNFMEYLNGK